MKVAWVFAAFIGFTVIAVWASFWKQKQRARHMALVAMRSGLIYQRDGSSLLNRGLAEIPLFMLAGARQGRIGSVLSCKVHGMSAHACDYHYWTGSVNSRRFDYRQTVACFQTRENLPAFTLYPRTGPLGGASGALNRGAVKLLAGMAEPMMGGARAPALDAILDEAEDPGIQAPGCPKFSETYRLQGSDSASLRRLFSPAFTDRLLALAKPVSVECAGGWLVLYRRKELVNPEDGPRFLSESGALIQALVQ